MSKDNTCKYIITCAHNFYGYRVEEDWAKRKRYILVDNTFPADLDKYKIGIQQEIMELPERKNLPLVPGFKILKVYIPEEYKTYVKNIVAFKNKLHDKTVVEFPELSANIPA